MRLADFAYDSGELARIAAMPFGRWTYLVPAGASYSVQASADGYQDGQASISVGDMPATLDLALLPVAAIPALPPGALPVLALLLAFSARRLFRG